ncbi:MAG: hypothetical protein JW829_10505, partial [Pirellulales bacterium]|nr:hypothetical protein [Pirellulales bacterium]
MLNARLIGVLPALLIFVSMAAAEPTARLDTYRQSDGVTFFAASLAAGQELPVIDRHDVVVLFDTSASQTSLYRDSAIAALDGLLAGLSPSDRVKLIAVDLTASALSDQFIAPKGDAIQAARTKLLARPPLGSTDMETALQTAANAWDEASDTARAVVYIGDGVSMINLLNGQKLQALIEDLIAARAPISSLAVGPRTDTQLLAVLANQTGGNLYVAEPLVFADPDQGILPERAEAENIRRSRLAGARLAAWTQAAVVWPIDFQLPKVFKEVYPAKVPPLRSDRSTILIGQLDGPVTEPLPMNVLVASGSEQIQLSFTATGQPSNPDQAFLASLVERARADAGLTLPTVGDEGLAEVRRLVRSNLDQLTMLAEQAATTGNTQGAQRIAQAVLHHDPGNLRAETVHLLAARAPGAGRDASPTDLRLVAQAESAADEPAAESPASTDFEAQPGSFLDSHVEHSAIVAELIRKEVELALDDARRTMSENPDQVIQDLKLARENIRRAPELDMETQTVLISRLESAIKEAGQRQADRDERLREQLERQRAARAQRDMNDRFLRTIQKQKQRMESFESLMDENRYKEAVDMAGLVEEVDPNGVVPRVATLWARLAGNERDMQIIRAERHRAFFDALYQSERSSVPFPDEPPIVYPPADVWEELTYRRKKYRAVDLKSQGGAEEKIMAALEEQIGEPLEFIETPLSDAINLIKDDYKIEIQLDKPALEDLAISTDTPVTASYQGISLRSALRLMLSELELTYVIKDEVLLITTQEKASEELTVKVYPVADLVLPIQNTMMGGFGGLGGGMGGGMMGGMGGM